VTSAEPIKIFSHFPDPLVPIVAELDASACFARITAFENVERRTEPLGLFLRSMLVQRHKVRPWPDQMALPFLTLMTKAVEVVHRERQLTLMSLLRTLMKVTINLPYLPPPWAPRRTDHQLRHNVSRKM
jgi:hypothetical protein